MLFSCLSFVQINQFILRYSPGSSAIPFGDLFVLRISFKSKINVKISLQVSVS